MRILAIILNGVLLGIMAFAVADEFTYGEPCLHDWVAILIVLIVTMTCVVNLVVLLRKFKTDWMAVCLRNKELKEQLDALKKDD